MDTRACLLKHLSRIKPADREAFLNILVIELAERVNPDVWCCAVDAAIKTRIFRPGPVHTFFDGSQGQLPPNIPKVSRGEPSG